MNPIIAANILGVLILGAGLIWAKRDLEKAGKLRGKLLLICLSFLLLFIYSAGTVIIGGGRGGFRPVSSFGAAPVYNIPNFHIVTPGIIRGAQPQEAGFKILKDYCGIKTILSLRYDREHNERERQIARRLGVGFINIPMSGTEEQSVEKIQRCLDIINDRSKQPVFVHCHGGKDRTGLIFAAYRIKYDNWNFEDAFKEMLAYGHDDKRLYKLKKSLLKYYNYVRGE